MAERRRVRIKVRRLARLPVGDCSQYQSSKWWHVALAAALAFLGLAIFLWIRSLDGLPIGLGIPDPPSGP